MSPELTACRARLAEVEEELARERVHTQAVERRFALLKGISEVALADEEPALALDDIVRRLRQELPADCATLLLRDPDSDLLRVRASDRAAGVGNEIPVRLGQSLSGRVAAEGRTVALDDVSPAEGNEPLLREHAGSAAAVPLIKAGRRPGRARGGHAGAPPPGSRRHPPARGGGDAAGGGPGPPALTGRRASRARPGRSGGAAARRGAGHRGSRSAHLPQPHLAQRQLPARVARARRRPAALGAHAARGQGHGPADPGPPGREPDGSGRPAARPVAAAAGAAPGGGRGAIPGAGAVARRGPRVPRGSARSRTSWPTAGVSCRPCRT